MPNENLEKLVQYARDKKPTDFKALLSTEIGSRIATKISDIKTNLSKTMFQKVEEGTDEEDVEHTHDDGTTHSHPGGDKEHVHEGELPPALKKAIAAKKKKEGGDDDDDDDDKEEAFIPKGLKVKEGSKEAYQKFFNKKLAKYKVKSPSQLDDATKKKFFAEIEKEWKSEDE